MKKLKIIIFSIIIYALSITLSYADILSKNGKISMELENVELSMVLNMIAQQNNLNMVLSSDVSGNISIRLIDVEIKTALDAILIPNGFTYYIKEDIISIKSLQSKSTAEFVSEVVTLNYASPNSVKAAIETLKSEKGKVVILDNDITTEGAATKDVYSPNKIFITDFPLIIVNMKKIIAQIDIPERLISITVKIIETKVDSLSKLGLSWPVAVTTTLGNISTTTDNITDASNGISSAALSKNLNYGNWSWGTLSVNQLAAVLDILEQDGKSKLLSYPNITTLENHQAEIKSETVIPIPTINRFTEGAATQDILTFQDEEVGISLKVTPRINNDGYITLNVEAKIEDIIGFTGSADSQKPITASRSIKTYTTVKDGETAALGGLLKEDVIKTKKRIPLLGSIPFFGKLLFTSTSEDKQTTDLIILITPKIVK